MRNNLKQLKLLHLVSPALPIGAYAYSQGLEFAIDDGWLAQEGELERWISGLLRHSLGLLDLPVLLRLCRAWRAKDLACVNYWNHYLRAFRETHELLLEDEQTGMALQRLLKSLGILGDDDVLESTPCLATMFALAGTDGALAEADILQGFAWSWLENQVAAATKLVPLGQTQAQKLLFAIMPVIPCVCDHAQTLDDSEIGASLPAVAMASAKHECQYSRLFRS